MDGVYRRINGKTVLSADELAKIAQATGVSIDELIYQSSSKLIFSYNQIPTPITSFEGYLAGVAQNLKSFVDVKDLKVYYASHEIPVFLYYAYPRILSFKLFMYGLTVWNFAELQNATFNFDRLSDQTHHMAAEMATIYNTFPMSDIWSIGILDHTLNPLEYMAEVERFDNPNDAFIICDELLALIHHLREMAQAGKKFPQHGSPNSTSGDFDLFYNQFS